MAAAEPQPHASRRIAAMADVLWVESAIRRLTQCPTAQCRFLETARYYELKRAALLRLGGVISHEPDQHVCVTGGLVLSLLEDATVMALRPARGGAGDDDEAQRAADALQRARPASRFTRLQEGLSLRNRSAGRLLPPQ